MTHTRTIIVTLLVSFALSSVKSTHPERSIGTWQAPQSAQWHCFNSTASNNTIDCCTFYATQCLEGGPAIPYGYCATYSEDNNTQSLSMAKCSHLQSTSTQYNTTYDDVKKFILLPISLSELNDYMCGPLNRKGRVCSQCADGYGPSVISDKSKCTECTNSWYGVLKYVSVEFVPITLFYFITLIFRIRVTTPPMPCFIMYAQLIGIGLQSYFVNVQSNVQLSGLLQSAEGNIRLDMKIVDTFYGLFNMQNILRYIVGPLCISSRMKFIHILFLDYLVSFYPIFLICVTLVFIKLHNNNFRPIVTVCKPFHKCFTRLHRGWDTKSDIIDVFIAFFFLSFSNCLIVTYSLLNHLHIYTITSSGKTFVQTASTQDLDINYLSHMHMLIITLSLFTLFIYCILPSLLLTLYPFKCFNRILSKCCLDSIAIKMFVDKIQSHYRNGLDRGKDLRSLSSLYLCLRIGIFIIAGGIKATRLLANIWSITGFIMLCTALTMAIARPYKKDSMNNIDTLLLFDLAMFCFTTSSGRFMSARILLFIPMVVFIMAAGFKTIRRLYKLHSSSSLDPLKGKCNKLVYCCRRQRSPSEIASDISAETSVVPSVTQPLIQPTSTEVNYNTCVCE